MGKFVESDGVDEDRAYLIEIEGYKCGGNIIIVYAPSSILQELRSNDTVRFNLGRRDG
jgi:hypothetical protein